MKERWISGDLTQMVINCLVNTSTSYPLYFNDNNDLYCIIYYVHVNMKNSINQISRDIQQTIKGYEVYNLVESCRLLMSSRN